MDIKRTEHPKGPVLFKLFVFPIIYLLASLPFFITNIIGDIIYVILYKLLKYRIQVVRDNLKRSFPNESDARLKEIEVKYYRHLSDLFLESLKGITSTGNQLKKRMKNVDQHVYDDYFEKVRALL